MGSPGEVSRSCVLEGSLWTSITQTIDQSAWEHCLDENSWCQLSAVALDRTPAANSLVFKSP